LATNRLFCAEFADIEFLDVKIIHEGAVLPKSALIAASLCNFWDLNQTMAYLQDS
jgi:hypothetical protein